MLRSILTGSRPLTSFLLLVTLGMAISLRVSATQPDSLLVAVNINGAPAREVVLIRLSDGELAVTTNELSAWRIQHPAGRQFALGSESYVRLSDLPGVAHRLDAATQTLLLSSAASAFDTTSLSIGQSTASQIQTGGAGGFLNYDWIVERTQRRNTGAGLFELGAFNSWGSGVATVLWNSAGARRGWIRLDTTWTMDMPQRMESVRLGDAIGRPGIWGRSVRFGGVQWTTNFATQPGFTTFPLPGLRGEAALPSTVDIYLENVRMLGTNVPAGPFDLANVPAITGLGELQMVVVDPLGRRQTVVQPYYASPQLLKPGLLDFSYEVGVLREDYGIASNRYGRLMAAATQRLGISPVLTRELRAELLADQQTVGGGGVWLLPQVAGVFPGVFNLGLAVSRSKAGYGHLVSLGIDRQARGTSFQFRAEHSDRDFVRLGQTPGSTPRATLTASTGFSVWRHRFGFGYLRQSTWENEDRRFLSASYTVPLGRSGQLGVYFLRDLSGGTRPSLNVAWTMALDQRTSVGLDHNRQDRLRSASLQIQRNLSSDDDIGYRIRYGGDSNYQLGATRQTQRGTVTIEAARWGGIDGLRAGLSGGIALAGGELFAGRRVDGSFAVVKVGKYADVRVYRDNIEVARTANNGQALITQLRAFQSNPVGIEQADLPMDVEVDALQVTVTPGFRSGLVVDFPIRGSRGVTFRLVSDDGQVAPPGSMVRIEGQSRQFVVGYDGYAYVADLGTGSPVFAEWNGHQCRVAVPNPIPDDPLPDLGTLVCKRVPP